MHFIEYVPAIFIILMLFGMIIVMLLIIFFSYTMNYNKHFKRRLRKLLDEYPIKLKPTKGITKPIKIKSAHYEALNNSKQFYEAVEKVLEE